MAQAVMQTGTAAGAQVKTTAMNNASAQSIANANRRENARTFNLSYILDNRKADEEERYQGALNANATRVTDYQYGAVDREDQKAAGIVKAHMMELQGELDGLDKNDPYSDAKRKYLESRLAALRGKAQDAFSNPGQGAGLGATIRHLDSRDLTQFIRPRLPRTDPINITGVDPDRLRINGKFNQYTPLHGGVQPAINAESPPSEVYNPQLGINIPVKPVMSAEVNPPTPSTVPSAKTPQNPFMVSPFMSPANPANGQPRIPSIQQPRHSPLLPETGTNTKSVFPRFRPAGADGTERKRYRPHSL